jgi:hypothetical protein
LFSFGWTIDAHGRPLVFHQGTPSRAPKLVSGDVSHQETKSKVVNAG